MSPTVPVMVGRLGDCSSFDRRRARCPSAGAHRGPQRRYRRHQQPVSHLHPMDVGGPRPSTTRRSPAKPVGFEALDEHNCAQCTRAGLSAGLTPSDIGPDPPHPTPDRKLKTASANRTSPTSCQLTPLQRGFFFTPAARRAITRCVAVATEHHRDRPRLPPGCAMRFVSRWSTGIRPAARFDEPVSTTCADQPSRSGGRGGRYCRVRRRPRCRCQGGVLPPTRRRLRAGRQPPFRCRYPHAPDLHQLLADQSHSVLDGLCCPILWGRCFATSTVSGCPPRSRTAVCHLAGLSNLDAAHAAWSQAFAGFDTPAGGAPGGRAGLQMRCVIRVPDRLNRRLASLPLTPRHRQHRFGREPCAACCAC